LILSNVSGNFSHTSLSYFPSIIPATRFTYSGFVGSNINALPSSSYLTSKSSKDSLSIFNITSVPTSSSSAVLSSLASSSSSSPLPLMPSSTLLLLLLLLLSSILLEFSSTLFSAETSLLPSPVHPVSNTPAVNTNTIINIKFFFFITNSHLLFII